MKKSRHRNLFFLFLGLLAGPIVLLMYSSISHANMEVSESEVHDRAEIRFVRDALRRSKAVTLARDYCITIDANLSTRRNKPKWEIGCNAISNTSGERISIYYYYLKNGVYIFYNAGG